jgi:hypothetical protein
LLLATGIPIWLLQTVYVPSWGIRFNDTPNDTAVIYGGRARLLLIAATAVVLLNLGLAWWSSRRRA